MQAMKFWGHRVVCAGFAIVRGTTRSFCSLHIHGFICEEQKKLPQIFTKLGMEADIFCIYLRYISRHGGRQREKTHLKRRLMHLLPTSNRGKILPRREIPVSISETRERKIAADVLHPTKGAWLWLPSSLMRTERLNHKLFNIALHRSFDRKHSASPA